MSAPSRRSSTLAAGLACLLAAGELRAQEPVVWVPTLVSPEVAPPTQGPPLLVAPPVWGPVQGVPAPTPALVLTLAPWEHQDWARLRALLATRAAEERRQRFFAGGLTLALGGATGVAGAVVLGARAAGSSSALVGGVLLGGGAAVGLLSLLSFLVPGPGERLDAQARTLEADPTLTPAQRLARVEGMLLEQAQEGARRRRFSGVLNLVTFALVNAASVPLWMLTTSAHAGWYGPAALNVLSGLNLTVGIVSLVVPSPAERFYTQWRQTRTAPAPLPLLSSLAPFLAPGAQGGTVGLAASF